MQSWLDLPLHSVLVTSALRYYLQIIFHSISPFLPLSPCCCRPTIGCLHATLTRSFCTFCSGHHPRYYVQYLSISSFVRRPFAGYLRTTWPDLPPSQSAFSFPDNDTKEDILLEKIFYGRWHSPISQQRQMSLHTHQHSEFLFYPATFFSLACEYRIYLYLPPRGISHINRFCIRRLSFLFCKANVF
jgi:hypothetical protein